MKPKVGCPKVGRVYLVGAGPGDPSLLTVKAAQAIRDADVVVYDRLVSAEILEAIPAGVSKVFVGKAPGNHRVSQEELNSILVRLARAGHRVVRLKGGDPFVFGRGGEEAQALARQHIRFEVIPGVTAATACAAYAGIPLTHRGVAAGVHLVTGHCREGVPFEVDWDSLACERTTLVVYMGLTNVSELRDGLIRVGRSRTTPVAIIERGTTPAQRVLEATLATLCATIDEYGLGPPSLIVIGDVVGLAKQLSWFTPGSNAPDDEFLGPVADGTHERAFGG